MRLWAISDLHVDHPENRAALEVLPSFPEDWLILAGDVANGVQRLDWCFQQLAPRFRQVVWVPGNHELWTIPRSAPGPSGVALYESLVEVARNHGVLTPEDPYPIVEYRNGQVLIVPLFLLYDYSFRPWHVRRDEVVRWAREGGSVCATNSSCTLTRFQTGTLGALHAARMPRHGSDPIRRVSPRS